MDERDVYVQDLRQRLAKWDERRDHLRAQLRDADPTRRAEVERRMETADLKRRALEQQIDDLEERPQSGWEDFKEAVERAWGELGQALDDTVRTHER